MIESRLAILDLGNHFWSTLPARKETLGPLIEEHWMKTRYLVTVVGQVYPQRSHAVKNKLHGGEQVVQHRRLWRDGGQGVAWMKCASVIIVTVVLVHAACTPVASFRGWHYNLLGWMTEHRNIGRRRWNTQFTCSSSKCHFGSSFSFANFGRMSLDFWVFHSSFFLNCGLSSYL